MIPDADLAMFKSWIQPITTRTTMTNGPELWNKILAQMPPGSIIAGGAIRDFMIDTQPKDIDVFCAQSSFRQLPEGFYSIDGSDNRAEEYQAMSEIDVVVRGEIEGLQVDLVVMNLEPFNGETLTDVFDVSTSQFWYVDNAARSRSGAMTDLMNDRVTVLRHQRLPRTIERFERFNARHDGRFQLIGAEHDPL